MENLITDLTNYIEDAEEALQATMGHLHGIAGARDLIGNLLHWIEARGGDVEAELAKAVADFQAERKAVR